MIRFSREASLVFLANRIRIVLLNYIEMMEFDVPRSSPRANMKNNFVKVSFGLGFVGIFARKVVEHQIPSVLYIFP